MHVERPFAIVARFAFSLVLAGLLLSCASADLPSPPDNSGALAKFLAVPRTPAPREGTYIGGDGAELGFKGYLAHEQDERVGEMFDRFDITDDTMVIHSNDRRVHIDSWPDAGATPSVTRASGRRRARPRAGRGPGRP